MTIYKHSQNVICDSDLERFSSSSLYVFNDLSSDLFFTLSMDYHQGDNVALISPGAYVRWINKDSQKSVFLKGLSSINGNSISQGQGVKIAPGNSLELLIINIANTQPYYTGSAISLSGNYTIDTLPSSGGGIALTYSSPNDTNGLFYYLGTNGLTTSWSNPYPSIISITHPNNHLDQVAQATNRILNDGSDAIQANNPPLFIVTLPAGKTLQLNRYTIYCRENSYRASTWKVEGSNDNSTFTTIHTESSTQNWTGGVWYISPSISSSTAYRYFKFTLLTGTTGNNEWDLNEFELYGTLNI